MSAMVAEPLPGTDSSLWYLGRSTGVVTLLLLTAVVFMGVVVRRGGTLGGLPRFAVAGLHRNTALLALVLLAVHVTCAVTDPYAPIRVADLVVPFASEYRPVWLGLGTTALDLLVAVVVTSLLRVRLGRRVWRTVHWLTVAAWPVALVHALGTGTDARQWWLLALAAACVATVLTAALWRLAGTAPPDRRLRLGAAVAALVLPLALGAWVWRGPLAPNWAARAGTPQALLAGGAGGATPTPAPTPSTHALPAGVASVFGDAERNVSAGRTTVVLSGLLNGGPGGRLQLVLHGREGGRSEGAITILDGTATLLPANDVGRYVGTVTDFQGSSFTASLSGPAGRVSVRGDIAVDFMQNAFSGSVTFS